MKLLSLILVGTTIVGLAACTPSSKTTLPTTTTTPAASTTPSPTASTDSSGVTRAPTSTAPSPPAVPTTTMTTALPFCAPSQLKGSYAGRNGAGGMGFYALEVTNTGPQACPVGGFFGVSVYDQAGHLLTATDTRDTSFNPVAPVELNPAATATFIVAASETPAGNAASCPVIGAFHLIPPNATTALQIAVPASENLQYCAGSTGVSVRPTVTGAHPVGQ